MSRYRPRHAAPRSAQPLRTALTVTGMTATLGASMLVAPGSASAAPGSASTAPTAALSASAATAVGSRAVAEAARNVGKPYRYGAQGPNAFDCSGFTRYVYSRVGVALPRTAAAQHGAARRISKAAMQPGDLIFMRRAGKVSHVGIYAGDNTMWVARRTGTTITRQRIWTSNYEVGRAT